jgi:hypothetical protein
MGLIAAGWIFVLLLVLESFAPLRRLKRARGPRYVVTSALTGLGFLAGVLAVRPAALGGASWAANHSFGLLHLVSLPLWVQVAGGVLLMDLTFYYWHRLNHTRPLLWRFHNVHHADPDMDVTTSWGERAEPRAMRIVVRTAQRSAAIDAEAITVAPLRNRRKADGTVLVSRVVEAFTRFEWDGVGGVGIAEYNDRLVADRPVGVPL